MHFKVAAEDKTNHRYSGVLVHPTSFPSPYGIGDMGRATLLPVHLFRQDRCEEGRAHYQSLQ